MTNCIHLGKLRFGAFTFDQSALKKISNEKCVKCDDFDVSRYIVFSPH